MGIIDCKGNALTRRDIDDLVMELDIPVIEIHCGNWAFMKIRDMYEGWLEVPMILSGLAVMQGVYPYILKKFLVVSGLDNGELKFFDEDKNIIAEIVNYSTSC